jgi:hypothetical protein
MQQVECLKRVRGVAPGPKTSQVVQGFGFRNTFHRHRAFCALLVGRLVKKTRGLSIQTAEALKSLRTNDILIERGFAALFLCYRETHYNGCLSTQHLSVWEGGATRDGNVRPG